MTRFAPFVEFFEIRGIPILGNFDNGCIVGLTASAARTCQNVLNDEQPPEAIKAEDENLYAYLTSNGFFDAAPKHDHLESAYLHVTQRCNLSCRGCYSFDDTRNTLEDPTFENLIKALEGLRACGVSDLKITGGEPFLRADLPEILRAAKERFGFEKTTIATNGTCVSDEQLSAIAPWTDALVIAFDGVSDSSPACIRGEQRFSQLVDAARRAQRAGMQVKILPTIHRKNIEDIPLYKDLAEKLGVSLDFTLLSQPANRSDIAELIPDNADLQRLASLTMANFQPGEKGAPFGVSLTAKHSCGAGTKLLSIAADGTVFPCHMLHAESMAMGNAYTQDLSEIMAGKKEGAFPLATTPESCTRCDYLRICAGGCTARAHNSDSACDPYCLFCHEAYASFFDRIGTINH